MARPTASTVLALTGLDVDTTVVDAVIDDAAILADPCSASWTEEQETAILKWLAAHLLASTHDGAVTKSESLGDASMTWQRPQVGEALRGTSYGQQALALDHTGCLIRRGRPKATMEVI